MIYDYLFYKSYQLAQRSKNFEDTPVIGGIWFGVLPCAMFNVFTLMFLVDVVFKLSKSVNFIVNYKYIFSAILVVLILLYYKHKERWKRIVAKYEEKEGGKGIHPAIVLTIAYIGSFVLLLLAGMYKNGDGIFA